ncbi:hypothetical protein JRO89_XS09G0132200 [Xanthoceras sorbifolium]|uniref:Disease resistance protein At4g27190-like leucine-rich repeats domain-containing protein n=1 Tax=Xanthoceras sorbifolium TaxID=99658 RepID=A0ABQ8HL65_9ROSI|nr:hypothetical protein JRO89_XS09G0132200 [Xanthoceras sorbifolium]
MDCVSPILDIVTRLWDCTANRAVYICDLQDNLNTLRDLKLELENISKDVETRADFAEQYQYSARTNQVKGWLQTVQLKLKEVDDILQKVDTKLIMEELECLEKITDIGLTFSSVDFVLKFMASPKLQSCITRLSMNDCEDLQSLEISSSIMSRMEHLEMLRIRNCLALREVKICLENGERMQRSESNCFRNLQILSIWGSAMENLTWLIYTPRLKFLYVIECVSLEEIIASKFGSSEIEEDVEIFSSLKQVYFRDLPKLKSICRRAMPFSSLRSIKVDRCPSLTKLPFTAETAKSLKAIGGDRDWWDKLEWEDEAIKHSFTSKLQPTSVPVR